MPMSMHCLSNNLQNKLVIASHVCMKKVFGLARSTPTHLILSKYNLYPFEHCVNLKLYVLVNRCLTHRVSPLVSSLFIDRSLGPRTSVLTLWSKHCCPRSSPNIVQIWLSLCFFSSCRQMECVLYSAHIHNTILCV